MPRNGISRRSVLKSGAAGAAAATGLALGTGTAAAATASKVDVALYVDDHVYQDHGYDPAWTLQNMLGESLEYNEVYDYSLTVVREHSFDVRDLSSTGACDDILPGFDDWLKSNNLKSAHENHHLIYHSEDSLAGCAWPRVSVGHGDGLAQVSTWDPERYGKKTRGTADDATGDAIQVSMQEVGHTLGMCDGSDHNCGMHYTDEDSVKGNPTLPGDGNDVYTTPMGASWGADNQCGTYADDVGSYDTEYGDVYWWYDCAGGQLRTNFDRTHTFTIEGSGSEATYDLTVSGTLSKSTDCGGTKNSYDTVSGSSASGRVVGGRDTYEFTGEITDFTHSGASINTYVDCEQVFVSSVGNGGFTVDGQGDSEDEEYTISVSGGLRKTKQNNGTINAYDRVQSNTADGEVIAGRDSYLYWGGILTSGYDAGGADVYVFDP